MKHLTFMIRLKKPDKKPFLRDNNRKYTFIHNFLDLYFIHKAETSILEHNLLNSIASNCWKPRKQSAELSNNEILKFVQKYARNYSIKKNFKKRKRLKV